MTGFILSTSDRLEHVLNGDASATFLIGSYDGSPNYGDLLQLKAAIDLHRRIDPCSKIFCVVDEAAREYVEGSAAYFGFDNKTIIPIFAADTCAVGAHEISYLPRDLAIHFYGGGYINDAWGARKRVAGEQILQMHEQLSPDGSRSIYMSGLQVSPGFELGRWEPLFAKAVYIGARDDDSVELLKQQIPEFEHAKVRFSGDDAYYLLPALSANAGCKAAPVAAHINPAEYSCGDPKQRVRSMAQILAAVARRMPESDRCEILIAYPEARIGENAAGQELIDTYGSLVSSGEARALTFTMRNLVAELIDGNCWFEASFLVTCSYHVALTGLTAECPTLLLAENSYYRQKASGLYGVFHALATENPADVAQAEEMVEESIRRRASGRHARGAHLMVRAQLDKNLELAGISRRAETARLAGELTSMKAAFAETALQLGELRRRGIVEEKLKRKAEEDKRRRRAEELKYSIPPAPTNLAYNNGRGPIKNLSRSKYLARSYWLKRRNSILKSLRKRIDRAVERHQRL